MCDVHTHCERIASSERARDASEATIHTTKHKMLLMMMMTTTTSLFLSQLFLSSLISNEVRLFRSFALSLFRLISKCRESSGFFLRLFRMLLHCVRFFSTLYLVRFVILQSRALILPCERGFFSLLSQILTQREM